MMTDKPLRSLSPQIVVPNHSIAAQSSVGALPDPLPKDEPPTEEEPYTIKCICGFAEDDGNTIYCETCDTWQHIDCFYPTNAEEASRDEFAHFCAECKPRPLDRQQAVQLQSQRLRSNLTTIQEAADKKPKRLATKSHKKKPKPTDLPLTGPPVGPEILKHSLSHEPPPPAKKTKTAHKTSHSISSQAPKRSPSHGIGRANHAHPPSPAVTPPELPSDFQLHGYSAGFMSLHNEQNVSIVQTNSFANLNISNTMSLWLREPDRLREETGEDFQDVFQILPPNIDAIRQPLNVESKRLPLSPGTSVRLHYLTVPVAVGKNRPLVELNGQIGFQKDYCADLTNRYEELSSPLPFVFFHPWLPLYIDTRTEGSASRYVRRSCKPNAVLDTYLSGNSGSEYHFWLVSDRPIAADEQVTIPWDFRFPKENKDKMIRLLGLGDDEGAPTEVEVDTAEYTIMANWVNVILSEYGGCACELGSNCAFARFHRSHLPKVQPPARANPPKKRQRKPKAHSISPTSTGHATNSRAASEGHLDEGAEDDGRSVSSKAPSRDMTPARHGSLDASPILTAPTARDKRKIAMVENSFHLMEQHQQPPSRKKKRVSDGTNSATSAKPKSRQQTAPPAGASLNGVQPRHQYVDAGTSHSKSGSPACAVSPTMGAIAVKVQSTSRAGHMTAGPLHSLGAPGSNYRDASVQTDPVHGEWWSRPSAAPKPRRRIVSLSKRLLESCHRNRLDEAERMKQLTAASPTPDMPASDKKAYVSSAEGKVSVPPSTGESLAQGTDSMTADVDMPDAGAPALPADGVQVNGVEPASSNADAHMSAGQAKVKSPELRVQLPPVPIFSSSTPTVVSASTPTSATSIVQSPFSTSLPNPFGLATVGGIAATPSPVKKKLSLSDWSKARKASRPSLGTNLKPTTGTDDPKSATSADGTGSSDSPTLDKANGVSNANASVSSAAVTNSGGV